MSEEGKKKAKVYKKKKYHLACTLIVGESCNVIKEMLQCLPETKGKQGYYHFQPISKRRELSEVFRAGLVLEDSIIFKALS